LSDQKYIHAGWLIDGSGGKIQNNILLTIVNGTIAEIESIDNTAAPYPALVKDLSTCTLLPPLVDTHVHLSLSSSVDNDFRKKQLSADYRHIESQVTQNIHYHFTHGILAVRDAGDRKGHILRYRNKHSGRTHGAPILQAAGKGWHKKGRYGSMFGTHPGENQTLAESVARETDQGDFIKVMNSGPNSLTEFGKETLPQFDLDELQNTVLLAERRGKKVMVHANGKLPVRIALEAGCHSIEHGFFVGRDNLQRLADTRTVWVPTAYARKTCSEKINKEDIRVEKGIAEKTYLHQLEQIALARELGVVIALGTDAGSRGVHHGESIVEEMKLLIKAGYSLPEAIRCASATGAQLLGLEREMGIIAVRRPANFLVARGTPAELSRKLSHLHAIYLRGAPANNDFYNM